MNSNASEPLLVAENLHRTFAFGRTRPPIVAVDDVSFTIARGGSLGLVGESGSGKSTIARIVVGLETVDRGALTIDGVDRSRRARSKAHRVARAGQAQMVFQDPYGSLDRRLTAEQTIIDALRQRGRSASVPVLDRSRELLDRVGLDTAKGRLRPFELSGGQRQRLAIARALALDPELLVLDEAVSALDVSVQAKILDLIREIRRESGVAVLFVSHDLAVVDEITDHVLVLYRGAVVEQGSTTAVLRHPEHPYTRLLTSSVPGPGWDPHAVIARRRELDVSMETKNIPLDL